MLVTGVRSSWLTVEMKESFSASTSFIRVRARSVARWASSCSVTSSEVLTQPVTEPRSSTISARVVRCTRSSSSLRRYASRVRSWARSTRAPSTVAYSAATPISAAFTRIASSECRKWPVRPRTSSER
nr:hypothetical protein [Nocardioides aquaticus]